MNTDNRIAHKIQSGSAAKTTRLQTGLFDPSIKHNSNALRELAPEHMITCPYSDLDEQIKNQRDGKGFVKNATAAIEAERTYMMICEPDAFGYGPADEDFYSYPSCYVEMLESGEMVDDGASCLFPQQGNEGATYTAEELGYTDAEPEEENQLTSPAEPEATELSADDPALENPITSGTELTDVFAKAAEQNRVPEQTPTAPLPTTTPAANAPSLQMIA